MRPPKPKPPPVAKKPSAAEREQYPLLKPDELDVLSLLATAWNKYLALSKLGQWDQKDFMDAIHTAQRIVLCRPAKRDNPEQPAKL